MEFKDNEAIYLQIAGYVGDNIVRRLWPPDDKIPSVRELAGELQVNPNTVMRTYDFLQSQGIVYNKRGIGFFVAADAEERVKQLRRTRFLERDLPEFFRTIQLLDIDLTEIQRRYADFQSGQAALAAAPTLTTNGHENQQ
jgi:DNA-binding transcriptional regulator YhcF (GntR family)